MLCPKGHETTLFFGGTEWDEIYCATCDKSYWFAQGYGLNSFDEIDPCSEGLHDWIDVGDPDDQIMECRRCGLIDA